MNGLPIRIKIRPSEDQLKVLLFRSNPDPDPTPRITGSGRISVSNPVLYHTGLELMSLQIIVILRNVFKQNVCRVRQLCGEERAPVHEPDPGVQLCQGEPALRPALQLLPPATPGQHHRKPVQQGAWADIRGVNGSGVNPFSNPMGFPVENSGAPVENRVNGSILPAKLNILGDKDRTGSSSWTYLNPQINTVYITQIKYQPILENGRLRTCKLYVYCIYYKYIEWKLKMLWKNTQLYNVSKQKLFF